MTLAMSQDVFAAIGAPSMGFADIEMRHDSSRSMVKWLPGPPHIAEAVQQGDEGWFCDECGSYAVAGRSCAVSAAELPASGVATVGGPGAISLALDPAMSALLAPWMSSEDVWRELVALAPRDCVPPDTLPKRQKERRVDWVPEDVS